jgi:hypothetical protein
MKDVLTEQVEFAVPAIRRLALPQPHARLIAVRELDTRGLEGQDDLSDSVTMRCRIGFRASDGVPVDAGLLGQLPDRPVEQTSSRSQLCACHH